MRRASKSSLSPLQLSLLAIAVIGIAVLVYANPHTKPVATAPKLENTAAICAALLSEKLGETEVPLPLTCAFTVAASEPQLVMTISEAGEVEVVNTSGKRFVLSDDNKDSDKSVEILGYSDSGGGPSLAWDPLYLTDVTYDRYLDLVVLSWRGAYQDGYKFYAYDPAQQSFNPKPILEATMPDIDAQAHEITSFAKGRGLGDEYVSEVYRWIKGKYVLVQRTAQGMVNPENPKTEYLYVVEELRDGKLVETKRKILSNDDVWGD